MELKKWMAMFVAGGVAAGGLMLCGAGPATVPAAQPVASNAPAAQSADSSNNDRNNNNNRRNRRGRGNNRDSSAPVILAADPYAVLQTRSIFIKGDQRVAGTNGPRSTGDNAQVGYFRTTQASALIFNGVILVNDEPEALVEDTGSGTVVRVRAGDPISGGRVSAITFGDLSYEVAGRSKHVEIGQTLEGQAPSSSSYSSGSSAAPTSMPAGGAPTGGPPAGGAVSPPGSSTSNLSPDDILARLKARRAAESSGGKQQ